MSVIKTAGAAMLALAAMATAGLAEDKVVFGTNWLAEAEHGGYYQAIADGTYKKYGLEVEIRQGGPQASNRSLLIAGKVDAYMGGPSTAIDAIKQGIPTITLAAIFQKDPQVILAHPDQGFETFADLTKADKIYLGKDALASFFLWMKAAYPGFSDNQYAPYTYNPAPFIADPKSAQQGYLTSEPLAVEKAAGWKPKVFLLADNGYSAYSTTIEVMKPWYDAHPDVAKRFIEASIIGWYHYLYGDNSAANALIKKDNPEMTDEQLAYSLKAMKDHGIVVSGDAETKGIGCMTDDRWKGFYDQMVKAGMFEKGIDISKAYDTSLVCKGLGMDLAK